MPERLELGMGLSAPARARHWILGVCKTCDLDHLRNDAALLVDELVTNAVLHARTDCVVVAEKCDDALRVEVFDGGRDIAVVRAGTGRLGAQGGRGLMIVAALSTQWGVEAQATGKSVWFTLATAPRGHAAPTSGATLRLIRS